MDSWGWRRQKAGKWVFLEMLPKMTSFYSASQNLNLVENLANIVLSISWLSGNYPGHLAIFLLSISWLSGKGRLPF